MADQNSEDVEMIYVPSNSESSSDESISEEVENGKDEQLDSKQLSFEFNLVLMLVSYSRFTVDAGVVLLQFWQKTMREVFAGKYVFTLFKNILPI